MGERLLNLIQNPVPMERPDVPEVLLHASGEQDTIHACIIAYANLYVNFSKITEPLTLPLPLLPSSKWSEGMRDPSASSG